MVNTSNIWVPIQSDSARRTSRDWDGDYLKKKKKFTKCMKTPTRNWGINIFYWADDSLETLVSSVEKKETEKG